MQKCKGYNDLICLNVKSVYSIMVPVDKPLSAKLFSKAKKTDNISSIGLQTKIILIRQVA